MEQYWYWDKALDDDVCDKILSLGGNNFENAEVGNNSLMAGVNKEIRDSKVVWLNDKWLYELVFDFMNTANKNSGWNLLIDAAEPMQLTKYKKKGYYGFHMDGTGFDLKNDSENPLLHNKTRKLSMSILLNDDFEGGDFQFGNDRKKILKQKGGIVVFPSFYQHRVLPVTKGVRHSLVTWFVGSKLI
jgi:PKHD-type hydroxylase